MYQLIKKILPLFIFLSLVHAADEPPIFDLNSSDRNVTDLNSTDINASIVDGTKMLWEVDGLHGGKVYLFGSIHVGKADLYPLDKNITETFKASNYLVLETKSNEESKIAMNTAMFKTGRFTDTKRLKDVISSKNYKGLGS
ncbi:MAG: TraB/GumN family protein, partial [Thiovulaceae bacterium]|nr:TraB/GumN family protein [Sulfurimonadaceae bacterium]